MLIFNYPYTDLYSLNLDWIIKAIKEVQQVIGELGTVVNSVNGQSGDVVITDDMITSILGSVVNSVNGQAGAVVITKEMLTTILEGVVNSFNGRTGTVQLLPADVNATRIDITWTSDPGDTIGSLTQAEIDALYADGKRVLIFVNNVGSPDQIYFLTIVGDAVTPQPYTPTAATSGVLSVNGQSGVVTLNADNLPVALGETDTIGDALDSKQAALTFDSAPTANSTNPVTSGGVYTADQSLGDAITTLAGTVNQHSDQIGDQGIAIAKVENGTTATQTINTGDYVYRNGTLYKYGGSTIATGSTIPTFSDSWIVSGGGLNDLNNKVNDLNFSNCSTWTSYLNQTEIGSGSYVGAIYSRHCITVTITTASRVHAENDVIMTIPEGYRPLDTLRFIAKIGKGQTCVLQINPNGTVVIWDYFNPTDGRLVGAFTYAV